MPWTYSASADKWAAFGYTYFRVLCCFLSIFLASVLVRVLHPCVALATQKLLRGCCLLMGRAHLTDTMFFFICLCTLLLWLDYRKHLAGTLLLQLRMEVTAWKASGTYYHHFMIILILCSYIYICVIYIYIYYIYMVYIYIYIMYVYIYIYIMYIYMMYIYDIYIYKVYIYMMCIYMWCIYMCTYIWCIYMCTYIWCIYIYICICIYIYVMYIYIYICVCVWCIYICVCIWCVYIYIWCVHIYIYIYDVYIYMYIYIYVMCIYIYIYYNYIWYSPRPTWRLAESPCLCSSATCRGANGARRSHLFLVDSKVHQKKGENMGNYGKT